MRIALPPVTSPTTGRTVRTASSKATSSPPTARLPYGRMASELLLRRRGEADVLPFGLGPQNALRLLVKRLQVAGDEAFRCGKRLSVVMWPSSAASIALIAARAADRLALYGAALVLHEQRRRNHGEHHHRRQRAGDHEVEV